MRMAFHQTASCRRWRPWRRDGLDAVSCATASTGGEAARMLIFQWLRTTFPIRGRAQCDQMKSGMHTRNAVHSAAFFASTLLARSVRVVTRDQEIVGADVEDSVITAEVKRRLASNKAVDASSISVETRGRIVMLPGFAQYAAERATAECLVWKVKVAKAMRWLQDAVCSRASGISAPCVPAGSCPAIAPVGPSARASDGLESLSDPSRRRSRASDDLVRRRCVAGVAGRRQTPAQRRSPATARWTVRGSAGWCSRVRWRC